MNHKFKLHFDSLKHTFFLQDPFSMKSMEWGISLWNYIMWVSFTLGQGKKWTWVSPLSINTPNLLLLYIVALFLFFSCVSKEGVFWENDYRCIQEKILQKRFCMGWDSWLQGQGRYQICRPFLLFCFPADCLSVATYRTGYMIFFLSSTLLGLNALPNCPSAMCCLIP